MKKHIAIVCGGDSSEWVVSLKSAEGIASFIGERYRTHIVKIIGQTWEVVVGEGKTTPVNRADFSYVDENGTKETFDFAYITIHGTPGENGILQGYFDLLGIPYSCCDVAAAALTFNKYTCNRYLSSFGVKVAQSLRLRKATDHSAEEVGKTLGWPVFVKPSVGGSSFGTTKVHGADEYEAAVKKAFAEGKEVIVEAFLQGTEVTCGVYRTHEKEVSLPITEVVTENEFFDYDAKYNGQVREITPARLSEEKTREVQALTWMLYDLVGAKGIIRADYIIARDGTVNLLEINTTPGMTPTSFIPQQVRAAGLEIGDVMADIIENQLN